MTPNHDFSYTSNKTFLGPLKSAFQIIFLDTKLLTHAICYPNNNQQLDQTKSDREMRGVTGDVT